MEKLTKARQEFLMGILTCLLLSGSALTAVSTSTNGQSKTQKKFKLEALFVDLSLLVASELPSTWAASFPPFQINHYRQIGPLNSYNSDILTLDEHTGTQFDAPAHGPVKGQMASVTADKVPVWQLVGEACVVDVGHLLDTSPNGKSPLIGKEEIVAWEKKHRTLGPGDVVLFRSDYSDKYYRPLPEGRRWVADPLQGTSPGWPGPDPECMEYLASRKVMTLGIDSPSMGPLPPPLPAESHGAGLKHGMVWSESLINLPKLSPTGAFYCMIGPKHLGGVGSEVRAFAVVKGPLASQLIQSARQKNVVDLSVALSEELPVSWPGAGVGNQRHPYHQNDIPFMYPTQHQHAMDSHTGTHLVPPAYALPPQGFDNRSYAPQVQQWLTEYEKKFSPRGTSEVTTEKVPISQTTGWARIIDVKQLVGTTEENSWPNSPEIRPEHIQQFEKQNGELQPGEIVIFHSGYSDKYFHPFPQAEACLVEPINGQREGWPAPGPETIVYLSEKGIRCVATDGPTLGGTQPKRALMTYWALGSNRMVGVEYLTRVGTLPPKAYFIFAAPRIRGGHGGPGRAIALY